MKGFKSKAYAMLLALSLGLASSTAVLADNGQDVAGPTIVSATFNKTQFTAGESGMITLVLEDESAIDNVLVGLSNQGAGHSGGFATEISRSTNGNQTIVTLGFTIPSPISTTTFKPWILDASDSWGNTTTYNFANYHPILDTILTINGTSAQPATTEATTVAPETTVLTTEATTVAPETTMITTEATTVALATTVLTPETTTRAPEATTVTETKESTTEATKVASTTATNTTVSNQVTTTTKMVSTEQVTAPSTTTSKGTDSSNAVTKSSSISVPVDAQGLASVVYDVVDEYGNETNVYWYVEENLRRAMKEGSGSTIRTTSEAEALKAGKHHSKKEALSHVIFTKTAGSLENTSGNLVTNANTSAGSNSNLGTNSTFNQAVNKSANKLSVANAQKKSKGLLPKTGQEQTNTYLTMGMLSFALALLTFYKQKQVNK